MHLDLSSEFAEEGDVSRGISESSLVLKPWMNLSNPGEEAKVLEVKEKYKNGELLI